MAIDLILTSTESQTQYLVNQRSIVGLSHSECWRCYFDECLFEFQMMVKMKSMFAIGFAFTSLLSMFNSIFDGRVVAKLPFTPITWLQVLSLPASRHVCFRFDSEMANHYLE